jgi:hypothetical protein
MWSHTPAIPVLRSLKLEDQEFQDSIGYIVRLCQSKRREGEREREGRRKRGREGEREQEGRRGGGEKKKERRRRRKDI